MDETAYATLKESLPASLFLYLEAEQKRLIRDSLTLLDFFDNCADFPEEIHDFAFAVFPLAKAYEGFLKSYFYRNGLIDEKLFKGRHFRVGRSFNPDLPEKYRDEFWLFDDVVRMCGKDIAREMWNVWLDARNHLFHYYPEDTYDLTLEGARQLVIHSLDVMNRAVECDNKSVQ